MGDSNRRSNKTNINTDTETHIHRTQFYWTPECLLQSSQEQLCDQTRLSALRVAAERQTVPLA